MNQEALDQLVDKLYKKNSSKIATVVGGWVARAAAIAVAALISAGVLAEDQITLANSVGELAGVGVLIAIPLLWELWKTKVADRKAASKEELAARIIAGIEKAKADGVVNFNDEEVRLVIDAIVGNDAKELIDEVQEEISE